MVNKNKENIGIDIPVILMPDKSTDLSKWSVVACDQYTSQEDYWEEVERLVAGNPSTLELIYPEVYLENEDDEKRIEKINKAMKRYLEEGVLVPLKPGFVYIDRSTSHAPSRKGLILCVDLEKYDYSVGSQSLIRATEGTVLERIPPRVKIRENAAIELPHIMLLIDDPDRTVIEPLAQQTDKLKKLYDFELMMDGGHIKGYMLEDESALNNIVESLTALAQPDVFKGKYGIGDDKGVLLFAVGDGNHSLASAKAHWENVKKNLNFQEKKSHPARFALVEVVNVHDEGLVFEPIHRVVFNINVFEFLNRMADYFELNGCEADFGIFDSEDIMKSEVKKLKQETNIHFFPFTFKDGFGIFTVNCPWLNLEVASLQSFLDEYLKVHSSVKVDYIHGEDVIKSLGSQEGNIGFFLPSMNKHDLFKTVILDGSLPRKTFSMGEAEEKRFYLECRKITKD